MRDYVLLYLNGQRFEIRGDAAFASLTDFLRNDLQLTGTKVVCAEGDCGACTVLVGRLDDSSDAGLRFEPVDACIQFLYQLDGKHVVTVEGLPGPVAPDGSTCSGRLHPVQQAMVDCHGSQCGFCTPGFVMALTGLLERQAGPDKEALQTALTGNLCRCTGYLPILEAGLSVDPTTLQQLARACSPHCMVEDIRKHGTEAVRIQSKDPTDRTFFAPVTLAEAIAFKATHPQAVIVSGGTELGVLRNKKGWHPPTLLSLAHVPGLATITCSESSIAIGANVTWTQVGHFARKALPELHKLILRFGSPQIRNVATLVGNVAHGSPIADSLPFLYVMDAELELASLAGSRRAKINGFYKGYKINDLSPEEIVTRVFFPLPAPGELLRLYKVSRRNDLDIATFGAAIRLQTSDNVITRAALPILESARLSCGCLARKPSCRVNS